MFSVFEWKRTEIGAVGAILVFILAISYYQVKLGEIKTRDAQRKSDAEMVTRGLWKYFGDFGIVPLEATGEGKLLACGYMGGEVCEWGAGRVTDAEGVTYINKLPDDPSKDKGYRYVYKANGDRKGFRVYVALENRSDKGIKPVSDEWCGDGIMCNWYAE